MDVFKWAINEMELANLQWREPEVFQTYLNKIGIQKCNTAAHISIQSYEGLGNDLTSSNTMVFRLGRGNSKGETSFALAKTDLGWEDYFIFDNDNHNPDIEHSVNMRQDRYVTFKALGSLTESSYVNLLLETGTLFELLEIEGNLGVIPATGRTCYTFNVRPNSNFNTQWLHDRGQVEVDSIFTAKKLGRKQVYVIEAKSDSSKSLAKHKLVYPVLGVKQEISKEYEIIPLYIKVFPNSDSIIYQIYECYLPNQSAQVAAINELTVLKHRNIKLKLIL